MAETRPEGSSVQGPVYETVEQPMWKSYLYQLQQKAPPPKRIICKREIPNKPPHYGKEFHGCISREEADDLVSECDGCYLVRESQRSPGSYTLTMRFGGVSKNFRLYYDGLHYVGEKRFQTIQDLVADGLITMYIDTYAKDYVDTMMIEAVKPPSREEGKTTKDVGNGVLKESEEADGGNKEPVPTPPPPSTSPKLKFDRKFSAGKRPSVKPSLYKKPHNFKMNTFKGPHWCDFCRNFLWGLIQQGVKCQDCGFNAHKQCSGVVPPTCLPDKKYVRRVFGVDLTTLVKLNDTKRPFVVDICVKEVEKRGMDSEGIYRVSGFAEEIEELKGCCDNKDWNSINLSTYKDINTVTGTLKLYFRLLPLPLITFETYKTFIAAIKLTDEYDQVQALSHALTELPHAHYETLKYLMGHLYRVAQKKDKNMMTEENLSIVFGPTLMRSPEAESLDSLGDLKFQRIVVERLISLQDVLFDSS